MKKSDKEELNQTTPCTTKNYFYFGLGGMALSIVALALIFVEGVGIYALICSILLSLAALSFFTTQRKKNNFDKLKIAIIAAYVLLGIAVGIFIGGIIFSAIAK